MSRAGEAPDVAGVSLSLSDARRSLGYATLRIRAGEAEAATVLIANAMRKLIVAEAELSVIGRRAPNDWL